MPCGGRHVRDEPLKESAQPTRRLEAAIFMERLVALRATRAAARTLHRSAVGVTGPTVVDVAQLHGRQISAREMGLGTVFIGTIGTSLQEKIVVAKDPLKRP